jgi:hypothetical protein
VATSTYLSNPAVQILTTSPSTYTSLTDQCHSAVLSVKYDALESSAFGNTSRFFVSGLGDHELQLELYMSYAADETYSILSAKVGQQLTVNLSPTVAGLTTPSATTPKFVLENCYLESINVIDAQLGELSSISITMKGGSYSAVVA